AAALDSIDPAVLEMIGRGLAVLAALRAPLFLIQYVQSIQRLVGQTRAIVANTAATHANAAAIRNQGVAADQGAQSLDRLTKAQQLMVTGAATVGLAVGQLVKELGDGNAAAEALGSTLQGAAIGAQLGSAFGPGGLIAGTAIGGGVGLITSFVSGARQEAERRRAELEELAQEQ